MSSALAKRIKHGRYANEMEQRQPEEELIVIGYTCNIFRDDEKADFMDEERHLIAHPIDTSLTMDRYDGRLYLHDLDNFDALRVRHSELSPKDSKGDGDVDEGELEFERYRDLMAADDYDEATNESVGAPVSEMTNDSPATSLTSSPFTEEGKQQRQRYKDEKFIPPAELELPTDMKLPETTQMHAIIAKTASFVALKGPQMEIVIKAKQKGKDSHFEFLEFDNALRPYYDHVLSMIKKGKYQFIEEQEESDEDEDGGDYLHPSLRISASSAQSQSKQASEPEKATIQLPTAGDLQSIISRLAEYVARVGESFEDVVRSQNNPLYQFIEPSHQMNRYYRERIYFYRAEYRRLSKESRSQEPYRQPVQAIYQSVQPAAVSTPPLISVKPDKLTAKEFSPKRRLARIRHDSRGRSDDERGRRSEERDRHSSSRSRRKSRKRSKARSRSRSDDREEKTKKKRYAPILGPLPKYAVEDKESSGCEKTKNNGGSLQNMDKSSKSPKEIDTDSKNKEDDSLKKIQEERRAKAKLFLKLLQDRGETASKNEDSSAQLKEGDGKA